MKLLELKQELGKLLHFEDTGVIDVLMAANLATRLELGNPIWLIIIGVSSGGKSQIIRPLATADPKFVHRVDDLTENTLISGMRTEETSLLLKIGPKGIIAISDLTTIFSKSEESRNSILGQLRLVYDGELTKYFGNQKPVSWKGALGVVAGSTPTIYRHFEVVADMGERFIYYRMKPFDADKAVEKALGNKIYGHELDAAIAKLYDQYQKAVVKKCLGSNIPPLDETSKARILAIANFAAKMRTPIHLDYKTGLVDRVPFSEMPMRVALQLSALARGMSLMAYNETDSYQLSEEQLKEIEWCAYSLANEERRSIMKTLAKYSFDDSIKTQNVGDEIGLDTAITGRNLQQLAAIGVLIRSGGDNAKYWKIAHKRDWELVRKLEGVTGMATKEEDFGGF